MFQKQKNIIPVLSRFLICMLIQGFVIGPVFALNSEVIFPECLSPRINISDSLFFDLIKTSCTDVSEDLGGLDDERTLNPLDIAYQKKQRTILQKEIINSFQQNNKDKGNDYLDQLELIEALFPIAEKQYDECQFESGEFYFNHCLEVAAIVAKNNAGFEEILAAVFHRMPTNRINPIIRSLRDSLGKKKTELFRKSELNEINGLIRKFSRIVDLKYYVHSQGANSLENFIGAVFNMMEGDYRIRRLVLADKQASIMHASETEMNDIAKEIKDIYAPLAGRFGMFEMKKELENEVFQIHNPKEYTSIMRKVHNTYGMEYEELKDYLVKIASFFQKIADDNQIDSKIYSRVKSPYRIYVKEKIAGKDQHAKDTLCGVDTLGIKIVCETEECFFRIISEVRNALSMNQLEDWTEARFKPIRNFQDKSGKVLDIAYINMKKNDGKGNLEVQFLTKKSDSFREKYFGHWFYEIKRSTGSKQKFDNVETFDFYDELLKIYQSKMEDSNSQNLDLDRLIEEYFVQVFNHHQSEKGWGYVFEKSSEIVDGREIDVVKPKRLPKGANGPVFAAQTGVDLFNINYGGVVFYEWSGSHLVPKKRQHNDLDPLKDGDIIQVKISEAYILAENLKNRNYEVKLFSSIRGFLRPRILLAQFGLTGADKNRYYKNAQSFLDKAFKQKGIVWGHSVNSKFPHNSKYMRNFLNEYAATKKLKNFNELFMALALQLLDSSEIVDWAHERGLAALKSKIQIDDKGIQYKLKKIYGSLEKVLIEVGIGKISANKVLADLKLWQKVNVSIRSTISGEQSGIFKYEIKIAAASKSKETQAKKLKEKIISILEAQGIDPDEDFVNQIKSRRMRRGVLISFEIPVKYAQLSILRRALTSGLEKVVKLKVKQDKKEREKVLKKIGLIINVANKNEADIIIRRFTNIGLRTLKDYDYDEKEKQLACLLEYDKVSYDANSILNKLNLSSKRVVFVSSRQLQKKLKQKQLSILKNTSLIESAI